MYLDKIKSVDLKWKKSVSETQKLWNLQNRCYSQSSKRNSEQTIETPVVTKYEKTRSHETFWNYICFQMKIFYDCISVLFEVLPSKMEA